MDSDKKILTPVQSQPKKSSYDEPTFYTELFKDTEFCSETYDLFMRELLLDHFLPSESDY